MRADVTQVDAWVRSLSEGGAATGPTAFDGYASMAIAEACIASIESGQTAEVGLAMPCPDIYP